MTGPASSSSVAEVLAGLVEALNRMGLDEYLLRTIGQPWVDAQGAVEAALGRHGAAEVAARYHPALRLERTEGGMVTATCACGVSTTLANNRAAIDWWKYHDAVLAAVPSSPDPGAPEGDQR